MHTLEQVVEIVKPHVESVAVVTHAYPSLEIRFRAKHGSKWLFFVVWDDQSRDPYHDFVLDVEDDVNCFREFEDAQLADTLRADMLEAYAKQHRERMFDLAMINDKEERLKACESMRAEIADELDTIYEKVEDDIDELNTQIEVLLNALRGAEAE